MDLIQNAVTIAKSLPNEIHTFNSEGTQSNVETRTLKVRSYRNVPDETVMANRIEFMIEASKFEGEIEITHFSIKYLPEQRRYIVSYLTLVS